MMTTVDSGLRIDVEYRPKEVVIALRGDLDVANAGALRRIFSALDPAYRAKIVVDCGQLGFIGAAGIGAVAKAACDLRGEGHQLQLVRTSPFVRQLFQLSGLGSLLPEPEGPEPGRACRRPVKRQSAVNPAWSSWRASGAGVAV